MSRRVWVGVRIGGAVLLLALVVLKVGGGPFLDGLRAVRPAALLAVVALTALTTLAAAWRWQAVSRCLGDSAPLAGAVAAYYRSQFLNSVLPGGVLGDVHRGVARGRAVGDVRGSLRSVAWDRVLGQGVQVIVTAGVLLVGGRAADELAVVLPAAGLVLAGVIVLALRRRRSSGDRLAPAL